MMNAFLRRLIPLWLRVRLKALYMNHYNNTRHNLIMHYIFSLSIPPPPPCIQTRAPPPTPPLHTHTQSLATPRFPLSLPVPPPSQNKKQQKQTKITITTTTKTSSKHKNVPTNAYLIIIDNFCITLFSGEPKFTALYNILQHFLSFTNIIHIIMTTNNV